MPNCTVVKVGEVWKTLAPGSSFAGGRWARTVLRRHFEDGSGDSGLRCLG